MEHSYYLRLSMQSICDDKNFESTKKQLLEYGIKGVSFFSSYFHSLPKLEVIENFAKEFSKKADELRKEGISVGINEFLTLGFFRQNIEDANKNVRWVVSNKGGTGFGRACINDENAREYIVNAYTLLAKANPDFILVDDDMGNVCDYLCYCKECLQDFENKTGIFKKHNKPVTREDLLDILKEDKKANELWYNNYRDEECEIYALIEKTVHSINPDIELGNMTYGFYGADDMKKFALSLSNGKNVSIRPGGGVYSDEFIPDLYFKANEIANQINNLPPCVTKIESEIECFPCNVFGKSIKYIELESLYYDAVGCTGTAFSISSTMNASKTVKNEGNVRLKIPREVENFAKDFVGLFDSSRPTGACLFFGDDTTYNYERLFDRRFGFSRCLCEIGVPVAYTSNNATVNVIDKVNAEKLTDEEIVKAFSKPVFMDGEALVILNNRGYMDYTGAKVDNIYIEDTIEKCIKTEFAGVDFTGSDLTSDCVQAFSWLPTYGKSVTFTPLYKNEVCAHLFTYNGKKDLGNTYAKLTNKFGGKVVISGYTLLTNYKTYLCQCMLKEAFSYLGNLSYVKSCHRLNLLQRKTKDNKDCFIVTNSTLDDVNGVVIKLSGVKGTPKTFVYLDKGVKKTSEIVNLGNDEYEIEYIPDVSLGYFVCE